MRAVIQRVTAASVVVDGVTVGEIRRGLCALVGVETGDTERDAAYLAGKIVKLRVFEDGNDKMNLSVTEVGGDVLAVSQFTLLGDARGQNRPGFTKAEAPERANQLFERVCALMREGGVRVETGRFRTHMTVNIVNDGPVTILLDSRKEF